MQFVQILQLSETGCQLRSEKNIYMFVLVCFNYRVLLIGSPEGLNSHLFFKDFVKHTLNYQYASLPSDLPSWKWKLVHFGLCYPPSM